MSEDKDCLGGGKDTANRGSPFFNKKRTAALIAVGVAISVFIIIYRGDFGNEAAKIKIIKTLQGLRDCVPKKIALNDIVPSKYDMLCIQPPYMQKDYFEKETKRSAPGFDLTDDNFATWWLYGKEGDLLKIKMPISGFTQRLSPEKGMCQSVEDGVIVFSCSKGFTHYSLGEQ